MRGAVALALLALLVAAAPAAAKSLFIGPAGIGPYGVQRDGSFAGAVKAWGQPAEVRRNGALCVARWPAIGLELRFANTAASPCARETAYLVSALATGRAWVSPRGLKIGAARSTIKARHPDVRPPRAGSWWMLAVRRSRTEVSKLETKVEDGRVRAFRVTVEREDR